MINFRNNKFIKSASKANECLFDKPHVIFIGRSNVGKSSLINALCDNKNLAFTSKQPGHTKLLNMFSIDDKFYLVDAPGYGYRKTGLKDDFDKMMDSYFTDNRHLKLVVWLLDSRRQLSKEDEEFYEFIDELKIPAMVVFTKSDKINQSEKAKAKNLANNKLSDFPSYFASVTDKKSLETIRSYIASKI